MFPINMLFVSCQAAAGCIFSYFFITPQMSAQADITFPRGEANIKIQYLHPLCWTLSQPAIVKAAERSGTVLDWPPV